MDIKLNTTILKDALLFPSTAGVSANELLSAKRRNLLKMIVSTLQPLETTEDSYFKHFIQALNPEFQIPTKAVIHSEVLSIYNQKVQDLRGILASVDDIVLTCELWSSKAEDSYLTVGCHYIDPLGNLKSFMLKTTSLFGDESEANIGSQLAAVTEAWAERGTAGCRYDLLKMFYRSETEKFSSI